MALDVQLDDVVRAIGGALWLGLGVWILARRRADREALLLGVYFCAISVDFVSLNVLNFEQPTVTSHVKTVSLVVIATNLMATVALAALFARSRPRRDATLAIAAALPGGILGAAALFSGAIPARFVPANAAPGDLLVDQLTNVSEFLPHLLLSAISILWALRVRRSESPGNAWLAAGAALFIVSYANVVFASAPPGLLFFAVAMALALPALIALCVLATATVEGKESLGPRLALTVTVIALALLLGAQLTDRDIGARGIARAAAFAMFVVALTKHALFAGGPPPRRASRGALIGMGLAALLIVAQVAQNFLSARYGLLMGGIVAGALLVAARPIERALEGRHAAQGQAQGGEERATRIYRDAVRHALRDRAMSRAEEMHLTELAEELRLRPSVALRIRHEVEDGRG